MKIKKHNKKHVSKAMSLLLASTMVFSMGSSQWILAAEKEPVVEQNMIEDNKEKIVIFLDGKEGDDQYPGTDQEHPVKTFQQAKKLAGNCGIIKVMGTVTVNEEETWKLPEGVSMERAEGFADALVAVNGKLVIENIRIFKDDIIGDGSVEGATEAEDSIYIPMVYYMESPQALGNLHLSHCQGDGVFFWENEELIPTEYREEHQIIFQPADTSKTDYSKEIGWNEEQQRIIRKVTVITTSLKEETSEKIPEESTVPEPVPEETEKEPDAQQETQKVPEKQDQTSETVPTPETTPEPTPEIQNPEGSEEGSKEMTGESSSQEPIKKEENTVSEDQKKAEQTENVAAETETQEDVERIAEVQNLINYLPKEVDDQEIVDAVIDATKAYEALKDEEKALINQEMKEKLKDAQEKTAKYIRFTNNVKVDGDLPWYVQFRVTINRQKEDYGVLEEYNMDTFIRPYDMKLWNLMTDEEYLLNGKQVKITLPAPEEGMYTKIAVIHYLENGSEVYITPVMNGDGTMSFMTDSFSPYSIVGSKIAGSSPLVGHTDKAYENVSSKPVSTTTTNEKKENGSSSTIKTTEKQKNHIPSKKANSSTQIQKIPVTGDDQPVMIYITIGVIALLAVAVIAVIMKKKNK